jgi:LAO/AO transport system kinase
MTAPDVAAYAAGVLAGERATMSRAITLVESTHPEHRRAAAELIQELLPHSGRAHRVGISGVPGAGKSTLIDELGGRLTAGGHRVAVLAVDPSSTRTGGSILADKTRMGRLANDPNAYIRPSPSAGTLGGVAAATREAMVVTEAAGYDVIIVETVGVGQSEVTVANMVDCFVVLTVARTGDGLQGIKRGILELAEIVAVNKSDGGHEQEAAKTARELSEALHLFPAQIPGWQPQVITCSGATGTGIDDLWAAVGRHREASVAAGVWDRRRADQQVQWMWATITERVVQGIRHNPVVASILPALEEQVRSLDLSASAAAQQILDAGFA